MKNKNIEKRFSEGFSRFDRSGATPMYFTSRRKLLELKRTLREKRKAQNNT